MSWSNKIDNIKFSIKTGDGKIYFPLWKAGEKSKNYNTTVFDFINVPKSLVERKKPQSNKHPLVFWFEGETCIEQAQEFEASADDSRIWTITHPYYGTLRGQPISMARNDSSFNICEISVEFWESIDVDYPNSNFSIKDNTLEQKNKVLEASSRSYASKDVFSSSDIQKNKDSNILTNGAFSDLQTDITNQEYQNAFADAQKSSDLLLNDPLEAIQKAQALIDLPSSYFSPVLTRIKAYVRCYERLKVQLNTISDKLFFESQGAAVLSSMSYATVTPLDEDYPVVSDIQFATEQLLVIYNDYLATLDSASVGQYDIDNSWQPDAEVQNELYEIVTFTIANLYNLSFEAQTERIVYTDKETNIILLTHRYLGSANDDNILRFRQINGIYNNELFRIAKGRKIIYYV
jgi:hypothetical protein